MTTKHYSVRTQDTDGTFTTRFASLKGAVARFEEMLGLTTAQAIAEVHHEKAARGEPLPTIEELTRLSWVSAYGTRVTFATISAEAEEKAAKARATAAAAREDARRATTAALGDVAAARTANTLALEAAFTEA